MNYLINFVPVYFFILFFTGLAAFILNTVFHYKYSDKVIIALKYSGFEELAERICEVIKNYGKLQRMGWGEGRIHYYVWKDFRKIIINDKKSRLYKYQKLHKFITALFRLFLILFSVPFIMIFSLIAKYYLS